MFGGTSLIPIHDENPTTHFPYITLALIVINVAVLLLVTPAFGQDRQCQDTLCVSQQCAMGQFFYKWGVVPGEITHGGQLTGDLGGQCGGVPLLAKSVLLSLLTMMFVHGGFLHLAGNMLFLWIFGNNIEDRLGPIKFLLFYLLTGLAATFAQIAFNSGSQLPTVGASGAISGILGAYLILFPRAQVDTVVPIPLLFLIFGRIRLPAFSLLGMLFATQ
jgi:membrane associated rhomboid family serine protease